MENCKDEFLKIARENIKREGIDKFLDYLCTTDFFTAPASSRFHGCHEGGLCEHSLNVYKRYIKLLELQYGENWQETLSLESATIISLFHDICKTNHFTVETRNVKEYRENGTKRDSRGTFEWVEKEYYSVNDELPYGHGEKSVYILSGFIKLTREEAMAINWHMGGFDFRVKAESNTMQQAFTMYPVALLVHISDMMASYLDEKCE